MSLLTERNLLLLFKSTNILLLSEQRTLAIGSHVSPSANKSKEAVFRQPLSFVLVYYGFGDAFFFIIIVSSPLGGAAFALRCICRRISS